MTLVPWGLLAAGSIVLALIFGLGVGVPSERPPGARGAIIRWAHALVWILLTAMFLAIAGGTTTGSLVAPLGLLALVTYIAFLATLLGSARR